MQLHFVGKNIDVTPALKDYTAEKIKPLEKRYNHISNVNIVFHIENLTHIAEGTVHISGTEIHATAESDDMYASIDAMAEKLLGQITKHKEKIIEQHR